MKRVAQEAGGAAPRARRTQILEAAYRLLGSKGFEGLRVRDIAAQVEINSATLHHYFATKESLIQGIVEHLMEELSVPRVRLKAGAGALERLRAEFEDMRVRLQESPEQLVVLSELALRGWRDPVLAGMLRAVNQGWRNHLVSIVRAGVLEGVFRAELDPGIVAESLMTQLRGVGFEPSGSVARRRRLLEQIGMQVERWLLAEN